MFFSPLRERGGTQGHDGDLSQSSCPHQTLHEAACSAPRLQQGAGLCPDMYHNLLGDEGWLLFCSTGESSRMQCSEHLYKDQVGRIRIKGYFIACLKATCELPLLHLPSPAAGLQLHTS